MQEPASTDPPEVSLSSWIAHPQGSDSNEPVENNLTDKLRSLFPSLYFSLTSWERATLDNLPGWNNLLLPSVAEGVIGADSSEVGPSQNMKSGNPLTTGVALPMSPSTPSPPEIFLHRARAAVPLGPPIDTRPSPISIDLVQTTKSATLVTLEKVLGRGSCLVDSLELQPSMSNGSPSHILEDTFHPSYFYEMTKGDGIINEVMENLIPSLH
jgi:hypothetical protein